jgi:tetratricopeptide (TPR) repeat protein
MQLPKGSTLGSYRIEEFIASGGMGELYKARHSELERWVAIKILGEGIGRSEVALRRFRREAKSASRLEHPHICRVYDFGEDGDRVFLVLEYLEGETLAERIARGALGPEKILEYGAEIAEALDHAHSHGLVHRDLKPDNVMLTKSGTKILDFGIAKRSGPPDPGLGPDAGGTTRDTRTLTREGAMLGTLPYMAPEQVGGGDADARTDIYALGVILYELIAGRPPAEGPSPAALAVAILRDAPEDLQAVAPSTSASLARVVHRCLEKNPRDRWQTAGDLASELRALIGVAAVPVAAPTLAAPGGFLRWASLKESIGNHPIAALLAGLVLAGGAVVVASLPGEGPSWTDRPSSVVVLPFHESASTEQEKSLAVELADAITQELLNWNSVRVVSNVELAGPRLDLGLSNSTLERTDYGIDLAREVDAQAMLAVTVTVQGDSASLNAQLFDSESGRWATEPLLSAGLIDSNFDIITPIVAAVLGFGDAPDPGRAFRAGTRNPEAAAEYLLGLEDLGRNRLEVAEAHFRDAVTLDANFSSALTRLAQTLFWRTEESGQLSTQLGPEISRWSTAAMDHLPGLSLQNRLHVQGFYNFQLGAYQAARDIYDLILESDPADVYALLMAGEAEIHDPWMTRADGGALLPRSDLNRAWESVLVIVDIRPTFELAYGQLLDIQRQVERPLNDVSVCSLFEELQDQMVSPWGDLTPSDAALGFCLVVPESFTWMPRAEFDTTDRLAFRSGADRLFRTSVAAFERWAAISPGQPRALEELSDAFLLQRGMFDTAAPELLQGLAEEALEYASLAYALQADTSSEQLVRLANLHLATGQSELAAVLARQAVGRYTGAGPAGLSTAPASLINVLVVSGQISAALAVASGDSDTHFARRPGTTEFISLAGAEPILERIRVLAAGGVHGPPLHTELELLSRTWRIAGYSSEDRQLLSNSVTLGLHSVAASLVADSTALSEWAQSVEVENPLWQALSLSDHEPERATELYHRALNEERGALAGSIRAFLLGAVSGKLGLHSEAIRHYSLLDSIPHSLSGFDPGWGLQVLAY